MRLAAKNAISMSVTNAPLSKLPEANMGDEFKILWFDNAVKQFEVKVTLKGLTNVETQAMVLKYEKIDDLYAFTCGL